MLLNHEGVEKCYQLQLHRVDLMAQCEEESLKKSIIYSKDQSSIISPVAYLVKVDHKEEKSISLDCQAQQRTIKQANER